MVSVEQAVSQELPIISVVTVLIADALLVLFLLKSTPCTVSEKNGTQWRAMVGSWFMHYMYCGTPKGTSPDEGMSKQ